MQLTVAARSDTGMIRSGNEDSFFADANPARGLFVVADGMGGHAAGEVASEMAVDIVARELQVIRDLRGDGVAQTVARAVKQANSAIYQRTIAEIDKQGMGTTISVLLLANSRYLVGQVGDSRVYMMREGALRQITKDHSYVQEQVDAGYLTPEQARYHPYSNVITRCVGASGEVEPDTYAGEARAGDVFLVASDGLTGMVDDRRLQQLLSSRASPARMVDALIAEANGRGGLDNITAIVITRCVGASGEVEPDTYAGEARAGDVFLVASDGLTGMVDDRRLQQLLSSRASPARMVDALIAEANGRGGLDNITAIVIQVLEASDARGEAKTVETPSVRG